MFCFFFAAMFGASNLRGWQLPMLIAMALEWTNECVRGLSFGGVVRWQGNRFAFS